MYFINLVLILLSFIGAYFGIAVSYMLYDKALLTVEAEQREKSVYHSDLFAMIGTIFLFCFWPSFNAGVAAEGELSSSSCC